MIVNLQVYVTFGLCHMQEMTKGDPNIIIMVIFLLDWFNSIVASYIVRRVRCTCVIRLITT